MRLTRTRGDTYPDQFLVTLKEDSSPANLDGCVFKMTLSASSAPEADTPPVYQLTGVVKDAESGLVEFSPTSTQADLVGNFFYDVQMTDAQGIIRTLTMDAYTYTQDITK